MLVCHPDLYLSEKLFLVTNLSHVLNGHAIPQEYYTCPHYIQITRLISVIISLICCFACMEASESCLAVSCIPLRMLKTDCSGETRLAPIVPSSLSWKAF